MTPSPSNGRGPVYFLFSNPAGFSGQKAAAELVIAGLTRRGWGCRRLPQPALERGGGNWRAPLLYLTAILAAWLRAGRLLLARGGWLCVSMGQTRVSFVRDAVPLLLGRIGLGRGRVAVALQGSLFMKWADRSLNARVFRFLLEQAGAVAVPGERQRRRLLGLGLSASRVAVVVNSCDLEPVSPEALAAKHAAGADSVRPVRLLHLSSLIDTKGFPEYLGGIGASCPAWPAPGSRPSCAGAWSRANFPIDSGMPPRRRRGSKARWRRSTGTGARVKWIKGAVGAEKAALYREADIFVLPTRYSVEAQPLVLLEAMASGCAILTTRAGEIPTILDERSAVFLEEATAAGVAAALEALIADGGARARLARAAHERFLQNYTVERHLDEWERLLDPSSGRRKGGA